MGIVDFPGNRLLVRLLMTYLLPLAWLLGTLRGGNPLLFLGANFFVHTDTN